MDSQLMKAVREDDLHAARSLLAEGANASARDADTGMTALMTAAGRANAEMAKTLLDAGADVFAVDNCAGATALHKACQGGSLAVVRLLVDAGAVVDCVTYSTGHTPLIEAIWFKWPDIVEYLLERGAGLNISTHYGFSLTEHLQYALSVNAIGRDRLLRIQELVEQRQESDRAKTESQHLMAAVTDNDIAAVKNLISSGVNVDERSPILNGFNDAHTPLLVAARDGHTEIVVELLKAGADVNATEPTFWAVPLHKAVYNGHADITRLLVEQPDVDMNFQGATNGYTPLLDAIWHGYSECAEILIDAGARLELRGHDGKNALDLATEVFGPGHGIVNLICSKLKTE